ncbi:uncharacterized, partial [Tachysurus ichikawai]
GILKSPYTKERDTGAVASQLKPVCNPRLNTQNSGAALSLPQLINVLPHSGL